MKYVFISRDGDILPLAQRIEAEGNQVDVYICKDSDLLLDKHITAYGPDTIVFDSFGFGNLANRLRKADFPVIGSSLLTDQLDNDSTYSKKVLQMCGLPVDGPYAIPITIDSWFNGLQFLSILYTLDDVVFTGNTSDKLFEQGIAKLAYALKKSNYRGPISLMAMVGKDSIYYKGLKARFAPASMLVMREGLKGRVSNVLQAMATGQNRFFMMKPGWFTSIQISLNSNPLFDGCTNYEIDVDGLTDDIAKHLWLYGFSKKSADRYTYTGRGGRIAVVTARGDTIREVRRRAYRTIHNMKIKEMLYLSDVGKKAESMHGTIKQGGWIC